MAPFLGFLFSTDSHTREVMGRDPIGSIDETASKGAAFSLQKARRINGSIPLFM
jgi:hypothetical protein